MLKSYSLLLPLLTLATSSLLSNSASASFVVVIDDFTSGTQVLDLTGQTAGSLNSIGLGSTSSILGGEREATFSVSGNILGGSATTAIANPSATTVAVAPFADPLLDLFYDGIGSAGLGVDLLASGAIAIGVELLTADSDTSITVDLVDQLGVSASLTESVLGGITSPQTVDFDYGMFSTSGAFDWNAVDSVRFLIDPSASTDVIVGGLGLQAAAPVPEPSAAMLLCFGGLGCLLRRSRSRS